MLEILIIIVRVSNSGRWFEEKQVRNIMPWVFVEFKFIPYSEINSFFQIVWANLLQKTFIVDELPSMDEQPGPPLSHRVTGSLFLGPLMDSTKT